MNKLKLRKGMDFFTYPDSAIGELIRLGECNIEHAVAQFCHAGIIVDQNGATFEALPKGIIKSNIWKYTDQPILIVDPLCPQYALDCAVDLTMDKWDGVDYPWWRPAAMFVKYLRDRNLIGIPVCSEVVAYKNQKAMVRPQRWQGAMPDTLAKEEIANFGPRYRKFYWEVLRPERFEI